MDVNISGDTITINLPIQPRTSRNGNVVLAALPRFYSIPATVDGKGVLIRLSACAYIDPQAPATPQRDMKIKNIKIG